MWSVGLYALHTGFSSSKVAASSEVHSGGDDPAPSGDRHDPEDSHSNQQTFAAVSQRGEACFNHRQLHTLSLQAHPMSGLCSFLPHCVPLQVYRCPRLLDTVHSVCLDGSEPRPGAVRLMVAISRAGRSLASQLVSILGTITQ